MLAMIPTEETLFHAARQIGSLDARAAYLDEACGGDPALRRRVAALLAAYVTGDSFLETPASAVIAAQCLVADAFVAEPLGTQVGPYKLLEQIGEGGMGVVYLAEQSAPVSRKVALKIVKPGMDTRQVITRFEVERQALARMDHPHIARILDAGVTPSGRPYFAMDLVVGVPITEYCDANNLPTRERLELLAVVCDAVQHAHRKGIIHRDLKPSNLLVTLHDGRPAPKIIDFGIAKAIDRDLTEQSLFTAHGQVVGTPQYMSPEQADLSGQDIDTRSDVYSLGVVLYELLTGTTPLELDRLRNAALGEMQRLIRDEEAATPSARLSTLGERATIVAQHRSCDPRQLSRELQGELDWIVMKALEKDRDRRYASPAEFAADVQRFLRHEPVQAGPLSRWYRVRKYFRRHRAAVLFAATVFVLLVAGIIGTTLGMVRAWDAEQGAVAAEQLAHSERVVADRARQAAEAAQDRTRVALDTLTDNFLARWLERQAELGAADRRFFQKIERQYQELANAHGNTPAARVNQANGNWRLAQIRRRLGDLAGAEQCARRAMELYQRLLADDPTNVSYRVGLAAASENAATVASDRGQEREAVTHFTAALRLWRESAAANSGEPAQVRKAIGVQTALGNSLRMTGQFAAAERTLREVVAEQRNALPAQEADPDAVDTARRDLAVGLCNLGYTLRDQYRYAEAAAAFRESLDLCDALVKQSPRRQGYRNERVRASMGLASLLWRSWRYAEAEKVLVSTVADYRRLIADSPSVTFYQGKYAEALYCQGKVWLWQHRLPEAERVFREALAVANKLERGADPSPQHAFHAAEALYGLGLVAESRRDFPAAQSWLEQSRDKVRSALKSNATHRWYAASLQKTQRGLVRVLLAQRRHAQAAALVHQFGLSRAAEIRDAAEGPFRLWHCAAVAWNDREQPPATRFGTAVGYLHQSLSLASQAAVQQVDRALSAMGGARGPWEP